MKAIPEGLLAEVTRRLVEEFDPEAIYLFGSHAWGTPTEDSDLDILIIVAASDAPPARRAQRAHLRLWGVYAPFDVLVRTRQEVERYRQVYASLPAQVLERGNLLYDRNAITN
ncbi:MAG: nucleotidyltransferase domain-containing protein [Deinococcota bacterium]|jgi:predicted nucleotidyltransferase|nr:nucleotidyltransferase domain-containing protein [Deinococcota bacterium]